MIFLYTQKHPLRSVTGLEIRAGHWLITGWKCYVTGSSFRRSIIHILNSIIPLDDDSYFYKNIYFQFRTDRRQYLSMFTNQTDALKRSFQSILMIAYFDPCFWSKTLKKAISAEHKCRTATLQNRFCRTCRFVKNFTMADSRHILRRSPFQLPQLSDLDTK